MDYDVIGISDVLDPTFVPTEIPTSNPTSIPTVIPTRSPTITPSTSPTTGPTWIPVTAPTSNPTESAIIIHQESSMSTTEIAIVCTAGILGLFLILCICVIFRSIIVKLQVSTRNFSINRFNQLTGNCGVKDTSLNQPLLALSTNTTENHNLHTINENGNGTSITSDMNINRTDQVGTGILSPVRILSPTGEIVNHNYNHNNINNHVQQQQQQHQPNFENGKSNSYSHSHSHSNSNFNNINYSKSKSNSHVHTHSAHSGHSGHSGHSVGHSNTWSNNNFNFENSTTNTSQFNNLPLPHHMYTSHREEKSFDLDSSVENVLQDLVLAQLQNMNNINININDSGNEDDVGVGAGGASGESNSDGESASDSDGIYSNDHNKNTVSQTEGVDEAKRDALSPRGKKTRRTPKSGTTTMRKSGERAPREAEKAGKAGTGAPSADLGGSLYSSLSQNINYQKWGQKEVIVWLKSLLLKHEFDNETILLFLREFGKKYVTGKTLHQFSKNAKFVDAFKTQFTKENQDASIWIVISSAIGAVDIDTPQKC